MPKNPQSGLPIVLIVAALLVGVGIGFAAGKMGSSAVPASTMQQSTYADGYAAAKKKLEVMGVIAPEPAELKHLAGAVSAVGSTSFTLTVDSHTLNPLVDAPATREVTVDASTVVTMRSQKDPAEFSKEMDAYVKASAVTIKPSAANNYAAATPPTVDTNPPPVPYVDKTGTLADIKVGDLITVDVAQDVKRTAAFTATKVSLNQQVLPAGAKLPTVVTLPPPGPPTPPPPNAATPPNVVNPPSKPPAGP